MTNPPGVKRPPLRAVVGPVQDSLGLGAAVHPRRDPRAVTNWYDRKSLPRMSPETPPMWMASSAITGLLRRAD
jgi:hypothetical protein